jgi:hypothetical protein
MAKASKATADESMELDGYEGHFADFGPYTVGFETYTADSDPSALFAGLPDDMCQCPHLGYVLQGRVKFTFADGTEEVFEAGDAYYAPPGHLPFLYAGSEVVEFSPSEALGETIEAITRNMEAHRA